MKVMGLFKKILLAIVALGFAFLISSCSDKKRQCAAPAKFCQEKQSKTHNRW
jgi:hypothetical protein